MSITGLFPIDWEHTDFSDAIAVKALVQHLANLVEALHHENCSLNEENQQHSSSSILKRIASR